MDGSHAIDEGRCQMGIVRNFCCFINHFFFLQIYVKVCLLLLLSWIALSKELRGVVHSLQQTKRIAVDGLFVCLFVLKASERRMIHFTK